MANQEGHATSKTALAQQMREHSPAAFAALGAEGVAYIKPVAIDGGTQFAVFLADGREVAVIADRTLAEIVVRQNDLEPVSVH